MTGLIPSIAAAAVSSLLPIATFTPAASEVAMEQPNVIVIMTDDMRTDDLQAMPQTRELLGARYTNAYVSTPLCCPSRATLLTGQYSHNHGVLDNGGATGGVDALHDGETLPVWLQRAGYETSFAGKYLNGYGDPSDGVASTYIPPGWDNWAALSEPTNVDYTDFDVTTGSSTTSSPGTGIVKHISDNYQTTNFTTRAVNRIAKAEHPMFLWLSYAAPHGGRSDSGSIAQSKYVGTTRVGLPKSPAVDEARIGDKPPWIRVLPRLSDKVKKKIVADRRERRDSLRSVDDGVADVVQALRDTGQLDNTVIMFVSDNGYMQGEHRIVKGKVVPYIESVHVPVLARGPGFTPGVHPEPVSNVDWAATVLDLAGATSTLPADGMSLLDPIPADRPILLEHLGLPDGPTEGDPQVSGMPTYHAVRQGGDFYVEYDGGKRELYDLADDPWQLRNRAGDATLKSVRTALATTLDRLRDCKGGECR